MIVSSPEVVVSEGLVQVVGRHGLRQKRLGQVIAGDADDGCIGAKYIFPPGVELMSPACHRGGSDKPISSGSSRCRRVSAQCDSKDVRRVWFQHDRSAIPLKDESVVLSKNSSASDGRETKRPQHC